MAIAAFVRSLPADLRLTVADIGSAGGLQGRWAPARDRIEAMLFEPREGGAIRRVGNDSIYPVALAAAPSRAVLNITALANMSSTLRPNASLLSTFRKKGPHVAIVDRIELEVDAFDAVCARDARTVDAIKVDTQGSELSILQGAERSLAESVIMAEVELSFLERYEGQPLAADIIAHMAGKGFELIELYRPKRYRAGNRSGVGNPSLGRGQRAGRIAYADGIFFIAEQRLVDRLASLPPGEARLTAMKAMLLLILYGKADIAARWFDLANAYLDADSSRSLGQWFRGLGRRRAASNFVRRLVDALARRV